MSLNKSSSASSRNAIKRMSGTFSPSDAPSAGAVLGDAAEGKEAPLTAAEPPRLCAGEAITPNPNRLPPSSKSFPREAPKAKPWRSSPILAISSIWLSRDLSLTPVRSRTAGCRKTFLILPILSASSCVTTTRGPAEKCPVLMLSGVKLSGESITGAEVYR